MTTEAPSVASIINGAVIQVAVLAMFHTREDLSLRGAVAFELVRDDDPWHVGQAFEQLAEKLLGGVLIPAALDQNVEHIALLIDSPPQIVSFALDREKPLVDMPLVARLGAAAPELIGIHLSEFLAPLPDGFVGHDHSAGEQSSSTSR